MWPPNDRATCMYIKILWDFHCEQYGYERVFTNTDHPEWKRNETQQRIYEMCQRIKNGT